MENLSGLDEYLTNQLAGACSAATWQGNCGIDPKTPLSEPRNRWRPKSKRIASRFIDLMKRWHPARPGKQATTCSRTRPVKLAVEERLSLGGDWRLATMGTVNRAAVPITVGFVSPTPSVSSNSRCGAS